jgi:hypothetical protein
MQAGMKMHLDLTLDEATARLKGDFAADIKDYDKVHEHILSLADTLSTGILAQFPAGPAPQLLPVTGGEQATSSIPFAALGIMAAGVILLGLAVVVRPRQHS